MIAHTFDWSVELILWLQQFSPALDLPFLFFTFLGNKEFTLLLLPFVYWCIDRRVGARLGVLLLVSAGVNALAKLAANQPRPFIYDNRVRVLGPLDTGGFPSGHTQNAVVTWPYLALTFRRRWLWVLAALLLALIPLSRLYLGLHFPVDLIGGYLIGLALLALFWWLQLPVERWLSGLPLFGQIGVAMLVSFLIVILAPAHNEDAFTAAGSILGIGVGLACERRLIRFETAGSWQQRGLRFLVAIVVVFLLQIGLTALFTAWTPAPLWRFLRYAVIAVWITLGAPWLFLRIGLAKTTMSG
jgi:membrane-associated phospholipid phosphatase